MKKYFYFVVLLGALICSSCSLLTVNKKASSLAIVLPDLPESGGRTASNPEDQHFELRLTADTVSGFTPIVKEANPGQVIIFEELSAGTYTLTCHAWNDEDGQSWYGWTTVTVVAGEDSQAEINEWLKAFSEHILLNATEEGVEITLKNIASSATSITVSDSISDEDDRMADFSYEFTGSVSNTFADGGTYTFLWPFAPQKVQGQNRDVYTFRLDYCTDDGTVHNSESVSCLDAGSPYKLDYSDCNGIAMQYEEPYANVSLLTPQRYVYLNGRWYETLMHVVTDAVPENKLGSMKAQFQAMNGDFSRWSAFADCSEVQHWSETYTPGQNLGTTDSLVTGLLKGEKIDLLGGTYATDGHYGDWMNTQLKENEVVSSVLRWQFSMNGDDKGLFCLPVIQNCSPYTPVSIKETSGILSVTKSNGQISLKITKPQKNLVYMAIEEPGTGRSYAFTAKTSGNIKCEGSYWQIPWAFAVPENQFYMFHLNYTDSDGNAAEETVCNFFEGTNGAGFIYYPEYSVTPASNAISSSEFAFGMPDKTYMVLSDLSHAPTLPKENGQPGHGYDVADCFLVYELQFSNGQVYHLRYDLSYSGREKTAKFGTSDTMSMADCISNRILHYCNDDESGNTPTYARFYEKTELGENPSLSTNGYLAFRLQNVGLNYIDSAATFSNPTEVWLGEYRFSLWQNKNTYSGSYPES